jgi:hypothetical protein
VTRQRIHRKDLRLASTQEKEDTYKLIDGLAELNIPVSVKEHKSGFPAVTVDCGEIHILTDILSLERRQSWHTGKRR